MSLPRDEQYAIAIDLGTTALKVGLVSLTGRIAWTDHADLDLLPPATGVGDGSREQDADRWWDLTSDMIRRGVTSGVVRPDQVSAVSCTGQWASTVPVDATGTPVGPCIMWSDTRGRRYAKEQLGGPLSGYSPVALARWVRRTAGAPPLSKGPLAAHHFLNRDRPDIARAARWYLEPVDYLNLRFTGVAAASPPSLTAHFLVDIRQHDRVDYDADLVRLAGLDRSKLPPLRPAGSVVGTVTDAVAADLGIPAGVPVTTGLPDIATAPAGSGAVLPGQAHLVISTTSWISCPIERKKSNLLQEILTIPGPTQGSYVVLDNIDTAGACFDWFRRVMSLDGARGAPVHVEELFALAETSPAGSRGVVFTPWLSGAQAPFADAAARAGFHNVNLSSGSGDLVRSVLEGVAVQNALLLDAVEKFARQHFDPIRIIGGGARSDLWCQIHADALNCTLERPDDPVNAGLRGAALTAAMTLGVVKPDEVRDLVPAGTTFRPDPGTRPVYERLGTGMRRIHRGQKRALAHLNRR